MNLWTGIAVGAIAITVYGLSKLAKTGTAPQGRGGTKPAGPERPKPIA